MSEAFNPYREWLGLAAARPNYYELLALSPGEPDPARITLGAEQAATKVRSFRPGPHAAAWSRLLDEIQAARQCLLDPRQRAEYDRSLAAGSAPLAQPAAAGTRKAAAARPVNRLNEEMYPPGMVQSQDDATLTAKPKPATRPRSAPTAVSELDPPSRQAAASPSNAFAGGSDPPAGLPIAVPVAPMGQGNRGYEAPAAGHGAYAPAPADPMAPVPLAGALPPGVSQPAGPAANPQAPYSPAYASAPMAPYAAVPAVPYPLPTASPTPYAAATPYAAPVQAPSYAAQPMAAYASSPMPLGTPVMPMAMPAAAPLPAANAPAAGVPLPAGQAPSVAAVARKKEAQAQRAMVVGGVCVALLLLGSALAYVAVTSMYAPEIAENPAPITPAPPPRGADDLKPIERSAESKLVRSPLPAAPVPVEMPMPRPPMEEEPAPQPAVDSDVAAPTPLPDGTPDPDPAPVPEPAPAPDPAPVPEPAVVVTRAEAQALAQALKKARTALGEMNFAEADAELKKAAALAKLPKHRAVVARLAEVSGYVQQFRRALADAVLGLDGGEVINVGNSTSVGFVEGSSDRVVLRIAGMNRAYPFHDMPPGLAGSIADLKLDAGEPTSRVVKGAYYLTTKRANADTVAKAKVLWEEAALAGVNVQHLMPIFDDNYDELVKDAAQ